MDDLDRLLWHVGYYNQELKEAINRQPETEEWKAVREALEELTRRIEEVETALDIALIE